MIKFSICQWLWLIKETTIKQYNSFLIQTVYTEIDLFVLRRPELDSFFYFQYCIPFSSIEVISFDLLTTDFSKDDRIST